MLDVIKNRFSPKEYKNDIIELSKIEEIVAAGLRAPSGRNLQEGIIITVINKEVRDEFSKINAIAMNKNDGSDPFYGAPVVLIVAHKVSHLAELNGAAMIENMLLEAYNQGLSARWINRAKEMLDSDYGKNVLLSLGLNPNDYIGVGNVIVGYSDAINPNKEVKEGRAFYIK